MLTQQQTFWGRDVGREQQSKGAQENCSATWLVVPGFMVRGFVVGFSLDNHSDAGSFLVVHTLLRQLDASGKGSGRRCPSVRFLTRYDGEVSEPLVYQVLLL